MNDLINTIQCIDLFDLCALLPDSSIDMILTDLPYGVTECAWDNGIIPLEPMWKAFKRVIKPNGAIVLTAMQPFTSMLVMSNLEWFRYPMVAHKNRPTGFLNSEKQPLRIHEDILVFYERQCTYNPQKTYKSRRFVTYSGAKTDVYGKHTPVTTINQSGTRYPTSIIQWNMGAKERGLHPTQKPIAGFRELILTFTDENEIVLDGCVGSGTTAIAASGAGRRFICGDIDQGWVDMAQERLRLGTNDRTMLSTDNGRRQMTMF